MFSRALIISCFTNQLPNFKCWKSSKRTRVRRNRRCHKCCSRAHEFISL